MVEQTASEHTASNRPPTVEVLPPLSMTAGEFETWLADSGMSRRESGRFFARRPRTIDAWRKGRRPVPGYAICMIQRRDAK